MRSAVFVFTLAVGLPCAICTTINLSPSDPRIKYLGRFDHSDPSKPKFAWVMTGISCTVRGAPSAISAHFTSPHGGAKLRVQLNGALAGYLAVPKHILPLPAIMREYKLPIPPLSNGTQTIEVYKVSEDNPDDSTPGIMQFGGFTLSGAGEFGAPPATFPRRIEFIGDSDTSGYCANGTPDGNDSFNDSEDGFVTWAQQIARNVSAETTVEAINGYGVTSDSGGKIQDIMISTLGFDYVPWNYSAWVPDAVVVLIGANDESKLDAPRKSDFKTNYLNMLKTVATNYANAFLPPQIIHVCGGSGNGLDPCDDIQQTNKEFNQWSSTIKGHYTSIDTDNWHKINANDGKSAFNGCDGHYNAKGHSVLANDILPQFKKIMGW